MKRGAAPPDGHRRRAGRLSARWLFAAVLAVAMLAPNGASARPLSAQEKAALAATIESFNTAMRDSNFTRVAETIPPRVMTAIAQRAKITPEQVRASLIKAMEQAMQSGAKIEAFSMDLGKADHLELASGAPYVLIPTQTDIAVSTQRVRARSHTLALLDDGKWYLLRINDAPQLLILREVYPEFSSVSFPSGSMEALKP